METMYPGKVNSPQTELASAIDDEQTTIPLLDTSKLPAPPNLATIGTGEDAETILYTGVSGNNLTGVTRGFQGAAKAWAQGTKVARLFTEYDYDALRKNILSHASRHAAGGPDEITPELIGAETPSGAQMKVNALAGAGNTKTVKEIDDELTAHKADYVKHPAYAVASGSANNYVVTLNPAPTSYVDGMAIAVKINADNTGAATINVNGLGAKAIKKPNGNDVSAGNLKVGSIYTLRYNGTNFILQGEGGTGNAQPYDVLSGKTFTNDYGEQAGTMPNKAGMAQAASWSNPSSSTTITVPIPANGYYDTSSILQLSEADLIPANIKQGVDIFGVVGTLIPLTNEKKIASGTVVSDINWEITVSGLTFQPSIILAYYVNGTSNISYVIYNSYLFTNKQHAVVAPYTSTDIGQAYTNYSFDVGGVSGRYVISSGFKLKTTGGNINFSWIAIQ